MSARGPYRRPSIEAAPSAVSIGALVRDYEPRTNVLLWAPVLWSAIMLLIGMRHIDTTMGLMFAACTIVPAGIAFLVMSALSRRAVPVALHERGLAIGAGKARREIAFDDIDLVYVSMELGPVLGIVPTGNAIRLTLADGGDVLNQKLVGAAELVHALEREVSMPQLPGARESVEAGETLTFGPIALDRLGIAVRSAQVATSWKLASTSSTRG